MAYDGYKEFYKEFYKNTNGGPVPDDYRETVLYILNSTGLDPVQVEAVSRYLGIGKFEVPHLEERDTLVSIGAKMNLSGAGVLQKITHLIYRCYTVPRRRVLEMGLGEYRETYEPIFGVSGEIRNFQEECGQLDNEYEILLKQAEMKKRQRDKRILEFAKKHEIDENIARRLAGREPMPLSMPEIEEIFRGGIPERWCR